jgi:hypothetical protein
VVQWNTSTSATSKPSPFPQSRSSGAICGRGTDALPNCNKHQLHLRNERAPPTYFLLADIVTVLHQGEASVSSCTASCGLVTTSPQYIDGDKSFEPNSETDLTEPQLPPPPARKARKYENRAGLQDACERYRIPADVKECVRINAPTC